MNGDLLYKKRRGGKRSRKGVGRGVLTLAPTLYPLLSLSLFACGQVEVGNGHKQLELEARSLDRRRLWVPLVLIHRRQLAKVGW